MTLSLRNFVVLMLVLVPGNLTDYHTVIVEGGIKVSLWNFSYRSIDALDMVLVSRLYHHHHCHPGRKPIGVDRKIGGTRKRVLGKHCSIIESGCDEIVGVENPEMINLSMGKEAQACFFCPYDNNLLRSPPLIESTPTHDLSSYH